MEDLYEQDDMELQEMYADSDELDDEAAAELFEDTDPDFDEDETGLHQDGAEEFSERKRRKKKKGPPAASRNEMRSGLSRVSSGVRRNAAGIKRLKQHLLRVDRRVTHVQRVSRAQEKHLNKLKKQVELDAALEFAQSVSSVDGTTKIDMFQLFKGAVKSGMIGPEMGPVSHPLSVVAIGVLLNNEGLLAKLTGGTTTNDNASSPGAS